MNKEKPIVDMKLTVKLFKEIAIITLRNGEDIPQQLTTSLEDMKQNPNKALDYFYALIENKIIKETIGVR